jgi:two-component system chemotaxis response regulator CheY
MDGRPILLVEDDEAIRQVMAMLLIGEGYPVQTATDGAEALEAIQRAPPSLVVLDMNMPVLDGWGFAAQAQEHGLDPPILVVTATRENAQRAAAAIGAAGYLGKPFELIEFLDAVETLRAA